MAVSFPGLSVGDASSEPAVLLADVLRGWLWNHRFSFKGLNYSLSGGGIDQVLRDTTATGLNEEPTSANETIYKKFIIGV